MTLKELENSIQRDAEPQNLTAELTALWFEAKGDWDRAHCIVQEMSTREAMWVHAYLHRVEGDLGNSNYWYSRANKTMPRIAFREEWRQIAEALLQN